MKGGASYLAPYRMQLGENGVEPDSVVEYVAPFAIGNLMGPILLERPFGAGGAKTSSGHRDRQALYIEAPTSCP